LSPSKHSPSQVTEHPIDLPRISLDQCCHVTEPCDFSLKTKAPAQARGRENKGTQLQNKALILVTSQQASQILAKQKSQKQQLPKQYRKRVTATIGLQQETSQDSRQ
jgi:hypothetical protein